MSENEPSLNERLDAVIAAARLDDIASFAKKVKEEERTLEVLSSAEIQIAQQAVPLHRAMIDTADYYEGLRHRSLVDALVVHGLRMATKTKPPQLDTKNLEGNWIRTCSDLFHVSEYERDGEPRWEGYRLEINGTRQYRRNERVSSFYSPPSYTDSYYSGLRIGKVVARGQHEVSEGIYEVSTDPLDKVIYGERNQQEIRDYFEQLGLLDGRVGLEADLPERPVLDTVTQPPGTVKILPGASTTDLLTADLHVLGLLRQARAELGI